MVGLNKITTIGELRKAITENNISAEKRQEIFITRYTRGIFKAIDLLQKFIDENKAVK